VAIWPSSCHMMYMEVVVGAFVGTGLVCPAGRCWVWSIHYMLCALAWIQLRVGSLVRKAPAFKLVVVSRVGIVAFVPIP
jgi:hypothetical protein